MCRALKVPGSLFFHSLAECVYEGVVIIFISRIETYIDSDENDTKNDIPDGYEVYELTARDHEYENNKKDITSKKSEYKGFICFLYAEFHSSIVVDDW